MGPWPPVPPVPELVAVPPLPFDPPVPMVPPVAPVLAPAAPLGLLRPPAPPMLAAPAPPGAIVPPVPLAVSLLLACPPLVAPASAAVLFRPELLQASPSRPATRMATTGVDFLNICFSVCSSAGRQVQSTRLTMAAIESAIFPQIAAGTSDLDHSESRETPGNLRHRHSAPPMLRQDACPNSWSSIHVQYLVVRSRSSLTRSSLVSIRSGCWAGFRAAQMRPGVWRYAVGSGSHKAARWPGRAS